MDDGLLGLLLRQALLLSLGVGLLVTLRPWLLRRLGASAAYAAWLLVPALLLTPVLPRPAQEPAQAWVGAGPATLLARAATAAQPRQTDAATLLLVAWLAGTGVVVVVQAGRQRGLRRVHARLPAGSSPALVGLLRPRLLLPLDFEQRFCAEERHLILAHEAVHLRRHDNAWNALACALTAVHWWNPLAWLAWRRMQADQELACDAAVLLAHPGAGPRYTHALLAAHGLRAHDAPLASRWAAAHPLVERITMLHRPQAPRARRTALLTLLITAASALVYAAQAQSTPAAAAEGTEKVDILLSLAAEGFTAAPRLITALGVRSTIEWGVRPGQAWRLDFTVNRAADGRLQVLTLPSFAGKALGQHTGVAPSGASFEHILGGGDSVPQLRMTRVVTLLRADFQMPPTAAKAP